MAGFCYHATMNREDFERAVEEGWNLLPDHVKAKARNVALLVEDDVGPEARARSGIGPDQTLLGLYTGIPLSERGSGYGIGAPLPDTVTIFMNPILHAAGGDPEKARKIIHDTVWHEVAHHFGMSESDVEHQERRQGRGYRG